MKNEYVYYVSFMNDHWDNMMGIYSDFETAAKAVETFVYNNNARLHCGFRALQDREDYASYSAYGKTVTNMPFIVYIQKIKINTPIEEA